MRLSNKVKYLIVYNRILSNTFFRLLLCLSPPPLSSFLVVSNSLLSIMDNYRSGAIIDGTIRYKAMKSNGYFTDRSRSSRTWLLLPVDPFLAMKKARRGTRKSFAAFSSSLLQRRYHRLVATHPPDDVSHTHKL